MDEIIKILTELLELLKQTFIDNKCDNKELEALSDWFDECAVTISDTPFHQKINAILDDGIFTKKEKDSLVEDIERFIQR